MMSELKSICPFWNKTCGEAREELHRQGADCDFITKIIAATPSMLVGAPPAITHIDVCSINAIQQSLNRLHEGLVIIMQLLQGRNAPARPPFGKG